MTTPAENLSRAEMIKGLDEKCLRYEFQGMRRIIENIDQQLTALAMHIETLERDLGVSE